MYDPEMRKDCPMRGNLGNCSPVGGFCMDAVSDEICEAVHNAYDRGFYNALKRLKEQEAVKPKNDAFGHPYYPKCKILFCPHCGQEVSRMTPEEAYRAGYQAGKLSMPEIVRCDQCKHWVPGYITDTDDFIPPRCLDNHGVGWHANDYCSYWSRKEPICCH